MGKGDRRKEEERMSTAPEILVARCSVVGTAADPNYRQTLRCGRHSLLADERATHGGADAGPMPFEYLLAALGSCTSITLRMYAGRKGWSLGDVTVSLALRRAQDGFTIERRVALSAALTAEQQASLAAICEKTPVTLALKSGTSIATTVVAGGP
jgi:putative redox protein